MGLRDDQEENDRIAARNARIKQLLEDGDTATTKPEGDTTTTTTPKAPTIWPPLRPWERDINGKREQWRRLTAAEIDAEAERAFLKAQWQADQEHAAKVKAAEREQAKEIADNKKRADHTKQTGRRPYNEGRFISLDEARARGYLQSENASNGKPEWWSEKNPTGLMGAG